MPEKLIINLRNLETIKRMIFNLEISVAAMDTGFGSGFWCERGVYVWRRTNI